MNLDEYHALQEHGVIDKVSGHQRQVLRDRLLPSSAAGSAFTIAFASPTFAADEDNVEVAAAFRGARNLVGVRSASA